MDRDSIPRATCTMYRYKELFCIHKRRISGGNMTDATNYNQPVNIQFVAVAVPFFDADAAELRQQIFLIQVLKICSFISI